MRRLILLILLISAISIPVYSKRLHYEKEYQAVWCRNHCGQTEYILNDGARVDCLTKTHAVEFDFASKWAESIGQALYYGIKTHRKPAVVLILENPQYEDRYVIRFKTVANYLCLDYWFMYEKDLYK